MKFSKTAALVTGAGGGMGLEIACQLIKRGINVCMADIKPQPNNIADGPGKSIYVQADLSLQDEVENVTKRASQEFAGIDYLANTMGVLWLDKDRSAVDIDMGVWDQVMNINLRSTVLLVKNVIPEMQKAGQGAMVHFSSIDALHGDPVPQDAYGSAKAALIRLSKSLAIQYAKQQIRSNVILPGLTLTPMQARWQGNPEVQANVAERIPLGRLGVAKDMAHACLFLLSDNASYITGTELIVDGGIIAHP